MLCIFSLGENATMDTKDDGMFSHDEADITIIYIIETVNVGKAVMRTFDNPDIYGLLVC